MIISLSEMAEAEASPRSPLWNSYFEKRNQEEKCKTCKRALQCKAATLLAWAGTERQVLLNKKEWAEYEAVVAVSTAANQCLHPRGGKETSSRTTGVKMWSLVKVPQVPCKTHCCLSRTYLIFIIFFTQAKFLENKIYTEKTCKLQQNTQ